MINYFPDRRSAIAYLRSVKLYDALAGFAKEPGSVHASVENGTTEPFPVIWEDLAVIHKAIIDRNVLTAVEYGVGFSTMVMGHAIRMNRTRLADASVERGIRGPGLFECHSVDASNHWIEQTKTRGRLDPMINHLHLASVLMGEFNNRICTYYDFFPQVSPDLIYLDAPDQFISSGDVRNLHTRYSCAVPMAADLLAWEHYFNPGMLIIVDGRGANARFLKNNFQRNWVYSYADDIDQHYFELVEKPFGWVSRNRLEFTLGHAWIAKSEQGS